MSHNPLTQGVCSGSAPLYYILEGSKLYCRVYSAISVTMTRSLWQIIQPYLESPASLLRGWERNGLPPDEWVGPNLAPHARWGMGGAIVSMRQRDPKRMIEFRIALPANAVGCRDLIETYASLDVLLRCMHRAACQAESINLSYSQNNTQLIAVESLVNGAKLAVSPKLIDWMTKSSLYYWRSALEHACQTMAEVSDYLGLTGSFYKYPSLVGRLEEPPKVSLEGENGRQLHFTMGQLHLFPRKAPTQRDCGYKLVQGIGSDSLIPYPHRVSTGYDTPEMIMATNLVFLCGLIQMAHSALHEILP